MRQFLSQSKRSGSIPAPQRSHLKLHHHPWSSAVRKLAFRNLQVTLHSGTRPPTRSPAFATAPRPYMVSQLSPAVRRKALRTFRQRGIVVHVGALECLFAAYESLVDLDFSSFLDRVFDLVGREDGAVDSILTVAIAESIAKRLRRDEDRKDGLAAASIEIIDIFSVPSWEPLASGSASVFGGKRVSAPKKPVIDAEPMSKADMFRARYDLMRGKTLRNNKFRPPASSMLSMAKKSPYFQLTGVESLAGNEEEKLVLGMLTQLEEGTWFLEDLNGVVRLDLSQASVTAGLHTECSFVIAQGRFIEVRGEEPIFQVSAMGTPPLEKRDESLGVMSRNPNLFGGHFENSESAALLKLEQQSVDSVFLTLSDFALDNSKVIAGLRHLFQGYLEDGVVPKVIILMGNFLSHPFGQHVDDVMTLAEGFAGLGSMIATDFKPLADESVFVIIPGTQDPGPGNVLPRPPMPKMIMKGFIDAIGHERVHLGTNPCRLRYMTQEIVILRDDLMQKMVRHCAVKPDFGESGLMSEHFVKSIIDQAHLCPLPNSSRPLLWRHAHAMWLFPIPHAIIVADKVDGYICKYGGTLGLNPGSFATDFSFQVYIPAERRAQQCSLNSDSLVDPSKQADTVANEEDMIRAQSEEDSDAHMEDSSQDPPIGQLEDNDGMGAEGGSTSDVDLPQPAQPMTDALDSSIPTGHDRRAFVSPRRSNIEVPNFTKHPGEWLGHNTESNCAHKEVVSEGDGFESSDDDSILVPAEGLERKDIKAFVLQATTTDEFVPTTDMDNAN